MRQLFVYIEIKGKQVFTGVIQETHPGVGAFSYAEEYIDGNYPSISIGLPVSKKSFSAQETKNFFEGLLPEGFARKTVSDWVHADAEDYLTILEALGAECLGAIRISGQREAAVGRYELLSMDEVKALAKEGISKSTELITEAHLSLTGASGKVGLYYDSAQDLWYKPIGLAPSTHIVKQSHVRLSNIVVNEQVCLLAAAKLGIETPESFIVNTGGMEDGDILFATKRYDRLINDESNVIGTIRSPLRLHQEDFAQALGIPASAKYETDADHYLKKIFSLLRSYSANPIEDQQKLWNILIYDFLVGNTDNHIKNLSLLRSEDLKSIRLAPAYDIVSTAIYPGSSRNMAIQIGGERRLDYMNESHFAEAVQEIGFGKKMAMSCFRKLADGFEEAIQEACLELSDLGFQSAFSIGEQILRTGGFKNL